MAQFDYKKKNSIIRLLNIFPTNLKKQKWSKVESKVEILHLHILYIFSKFSEL